MTTGLTPFFRPAGVVVVGVSTSPEKLGYGVARNLLGSGYTGAVHLVGQRKGELLGQPIFTNLKDVPDPVDLAVLIVPADATIAALEACGERGIRAAILVSAGFRESGAEGAELERKCVETAHRCGIRILGPNCIGTIDTHLPLDTTFLQPPMPTAGGIGFISHSGAFCAAIIDWSREQGFGFSQIASLGNQADISETEMLPLIAADEHTAVITMYMEGVSDGSAFVEAARRVTRTKPVIALKVGRFEAGIRAASSHTGALAGSDSAFAAAFRKAGVLRAESAEQMFDWARALEVCPLPSGPRAAVLTDAGGPGVIATDALEREGLQLAPISDVTRKALRDLLPPAASVNNPVDMLASASPEQYAASLRLLLSDPQVDSALVILPPPPTYSAESVADALMPVIQSAKKPTVIALLGSRGTAVAFDRFVPARIPTYPFPERAVSALAALVRRVGYLRTEATLPLAPARSLPRPSTAGTASAEDLLTAYGIPVLPQRLARSAVEAEEVSKAVGFPLAMKIASPDISHKSDVGGVLLNVAGVSEVASAYTEMLRTVSAKAPKVQITGINLQKEAPPGQEAIVGAIRDPQFGPLIMFGSGGVEAEGLQDVAFALAPVSASEAKDLIQRTWAGRRLRGFRNIPPADQAAVIEVIVRLSWLVHDHPEIGELEINPLRVFAQGVSAVDVRERFATSPSA